MKKPATTATQMDFERIERESRLAERPAIWDGRISIDINPIVIAQDQDSARRAILAYIAAHIDTLAAEFRLRQCVTHPEIEGAWWDIEDCHPNSPLILAHDLPQRSAWPSQTTELVAQAEGGKQTYWTPSGGHSHKNRPVIWIENAPNNHEANEAQP